MSFEPNVDVFGEDEANPVIVVKVLEGLELRSVFIEDETWFCWFLDNRPLGSAAPSASA